MIYRERVSIKSKLIISSLLIGLIPVVFIAFFMFSNSRKSILIEVEKANVALANQISEVIHSKMEQMDKTSTYFVSDADIRGVISMNASDYSSMVEMGKDREENLYKILKQTMFATSEIESIVFIQEDEVIDPNSNADNTAFYREKMFIDSFYKSESFIRLNNDKQASFWTYDLYNTKKLFFIRGMKSMYSDSLIAVLSIGIDKSYFLANLDAQQFGEGASMTIVDEGGRIVLSTDETSQSGTMLDIYPTIPKGQEVDGKEETEVKEEVVNTFITNENIDYETMVVSKRLNNGWMYVAKIPTKNIFGGINQMRLFTLIIVFFSILFSIILAVLISLNIVKPIEYLKKCMHIAKDGDLTVTSQIKGRFEMGQLSDGFNKMIINMRGLIGETNSLTVEVSGDAKELKSISNHAATSSDEIKLASQSNDAASEISHIVERVYQATKITQDMIASGSSIYQRQEDTVNKTQAVFKRIVDDMDIVMLEVFKVNQELDLLDNIQSRAVHSISGIVAISEQSAAAIEEVLATGEEQAMNAERLSSMVNELNQRIDAINEKVSVFKLIECDLEYNKKL